MTKISYVHGKKHRRPAFEAKAKNMRRIPKQRFYNYAAYTEGEFLLMLTLEQIELQQGYLSDPLGIYEQARIMVKDTLARGLHTGSGIGMPTGVVPEEISNTVRIIRAAKSRTSAAGLAIDNQFRPRINGGFDPDGPLIDEIDCIAKYPFPTNLPPSAQQIAHQTILKNRDLCREQNAHIRNLNKHYGGSAHQNLYAFISNPNSEVNTVAIKAEKHKTFHAAMHKITRLGVNNLMMWTRNGVMRKNFERAGSPMSPEETVELLRAEKIGELTIGIVLAIVKVALAVIATLVSTLSIINQQKLKSNVPDITLPTYGAQAGDFLIGGGGPDGQGQGQGGGSNGQSSNNNLLIGGGLAVAAGLLLLNNSSE